MEIKLRAMVMTSIKVLFYLKLLKVSAGQKVDGSGECGRIGRIGRIWQLDGSQASGHAAPPRR
jgi:hypothetical protein